MKFSSEAKLNVSMAALNPFFNDGDDDSEEDKTESGSGELPRDKVDGR